MKFVRNYLRTPKRPFPVNLKRLFPNFKKKKERKKERKKKKKKHELHEVISMYEKQPRKCTANNSSFGLLIQ